VVRHDILRTTYAKSGAGLRAVVVPADVFELDVAVHDVRERAYGDDHVSAMSAATSLLEEEVARRFDLYGGAALRVVLVQTGDEEHVLLVNAHHICTDEWSVNVLWRELHTLYAALAASTRRDDDDANRSDVEARATLPEPTVQYSDYAAWQRSWFEGGGREEWTRQLDFWRSELSNRSADTPVLPLRHVRSLSACGSRHDVLIDALTVAALRRASSDVSGTLFMALAAVVRLRPFLMPFAQISSVSSVPMVTRCFYPWTFFRTLVLPWPCVPITCISGAPYTCINVAMVTLHVRRRGHPTLALS
jgi:hypothetical protein